MKNISFFCWVICFFSVNILFAQEMPLISMIEAFQNHAANHPVEKIYLHLDKPYYAAGEYMYFRAYLTDINLYQDNVESGIIYVELSDSNKKLITRTLLYSDESEFAGQMELPDTLSSANYHLRAYTNWMRNTGEDYFYHRDIYIGNTTKQNAEIASPRTFDYQVTFFPEGGNLLTGLSNKVAFKTLGNDGFGADITGILSDSDGKEVLRFTSQHLGIGSFNFIPEKGKTYKVAVQSNGKQKEYDLPAVTEGITLSAQQDEESVYLIIRSTGGEAESIYLIGQARHMVCFALEVSMEGHEQQIRMDKKNFPTGIAQFTLFRNGWPLSERLVFIDRKDDLHINIIPDKAEYGDREKATVLIQVFDRYDQPVEGSFSLSVTDDKTVTPSIHIQNIKGSLLLDADLKGYIESPGWYFADDKPERAEALDNLLCTQGWTRFVWSNTVAPPAFMYPVESEFQITGKVTNLIGGAVKDASVILFSKENMFDTATTDENGRFGFYGFNCPDTAVFILQCRTKHDRKVFIGLEIDKPDKRQAPIDVFPLTKGDNIGDETFLTSYLEQAVRQMNYDNIRTFNLPEITVRAKRIQARETIGGFTTRYSGSALNKPNRITDILSTFPLNTKGSFAIPFSFFSNKPPVWYIVDNGMKMDSLEFSLMYGMMQANQFESVDVLKPEDAITRYGMEFGSGAFVLKTKKFTGNEIPDATIQIVRPEGYCVRQEFYVPAYDNPVVRQDPTPDFRTTIYWNPVIRTDEEGEAEVSFYTADNVSSYSYVLEGIGESKIAFSK